MFDGPRSAAPWRSATRGPGFVRGFTTRFRQIAVHIRCRAVERVGGDERRCLCQARCATSSNSKTAHELTCRERHLRRLFSELKISYHLISWFLFRNADRWFSVRAAAENALRQPAGWAVGGHPTPLFVDRARRSSLGWVTDPTRTARLPRCRAADGGGEPLLARFCSPYRYIIRGNPHQRVDGHPRQQNAADAATPTPPAAPATARTAGSTLCSSTGTRRRRGMPTGHAADGGRR